MRTLTEKYNGVLKGLFSKDQFLRDARMEQPTLVTQHNSYQDAVNILTSKSLISEVVEELPIKEEILEQEVEEKKLTTAEKAGKEKIIKGLKKSGMSKNDSSMYAIATAKAKELYEINSPIKRNDTIKHLESGIEVSISVVSPSKVSGVITSPGDLRGKKFDVGDVIAVKKSDVGDSWKLIQSEGDMDSKKVFEGAQEVNSAVGDVLDLVKHHARSLSDDDAFEFHEILKRWFNSLLEEGEGKLKVGDVIDHKGKKKKVVRIDGNRVFLYPVDGSGEVEIDRQLGVKNSLKESKEEESKISKPTLPLDVLHHGIRFELDKKKINSPTSEEYDKALKVVTKNLEKDLLYYKKEEGAVQIPTDPKEEMIKVKLKEGIKKMIRNILSEQPSKIKFDINGKVL